MISAFEYVTVLISIVLGLGITQILTGIANLFHKMERVKLYWPHVLWVGFVLVLHIQDWWLTYELKSYIPWHLGSFLFIMLYPINLFILARMLFPSSLRGKVIDLRQFYMENYKKIFSLFVISAILSIIYNIFILHLSPLTQALQALLIIVFSTVAYRGYQQEWIHRTLIVGVTLIFAIVVVIEWDDWLIR